MVTSPVRKRNVYLNDRQRAAVAQQLMAGVDIATLAARYKVTDATIRNIRRQVFRELAAAAQQCI